MIESDSPEERLILALDSEDEEETKKLVHQLGDRLRWVKVGAVPFFAHGEKTLPWLKERGLKIFLDLKLHDIPSVVSSAISICSRRFSPNLLTLHAAGGPRMFQAVRKSLDHHGWAIKPKILGVTVLTSLQDKEIQELGMGEAASEVVPRLAQSAITGGADGVVCSPLEVAALRERFGPAVILVTPGIRLEGDARGDQTRVATPKSAIRDGASYIVMGRSILGAEDPAETFARVLQDVNDGMET